MAWAVGRSGGHLRADPARSNGLTFTGLDAAGLLEDARRWDRVRSNDVLDPDRFLAEVVGGLFGARYDGAGGRLELRPVVPEGWRSMALHRLRAHRTLLDVEVRPRAEWITVRLAVSFGPPVAVEVTLPDEYRVSRVVVDDVPMEAERALFTAAAEHEVVLFTRGTTATTATE